MKGEKMVLDTTMSANIIETFSITTGVPAFIINELGEVGQSSKGFSPSKFQVADIEDFQKYLTRVKAGAFSVDMGYIYFTDNQFIYSFVPVITKFGRNVIAAGPVRFHTPSNEQVDKILRQYQIPFRQKQFAAQQIAEIPEVSMVRLEHLGRVLCSLCHAYIAENTIIAPDLGPLPEDVTTPSQDMPKLTFTLVEENIHSSYEMMLQLKHLVLKGDIAGIRQMRTQAFSVPLDRLIETDALISARYNMISGCGGIIGMIFDQNLPVEQLLMVGDKYIRLVDRAKSVPEVMDLMFESLETITRIVKKYSTQQHSKPVRQVLQYIQSNMTQKITLSQLSELTGLSSSYLSRLLKKETGMSLPEIINSQRIEESKYLLLNTDFSILEITERVGFHYQNHFTLTFKKLTGMTPTAFRQGKITQE
jgi:AraC-like DNA-binding protein